MDIIIVAMSRFDGIYSSNILSLAQKIAEKHRVFYIDYPLTLSYFLKNYNSKIIQDRKESLLWRKNIYRKPFKAFENLTVVIPPLAMPINWLPAAKNEKALAYDFFSKINDFFFKRTLSQLIENYDMKDYILLNSFNPFFAQSLPKKQPKKWVYQSIDDMSKSVYVAKHGPYMERKMLEKVDIALATSTHLARKLSTENVPVRYLPNAADVNIFNNSYLKKLALPKEIENIKQPIICYIGNIGFRLDYELLKKVATKHKDKVLLMLGPITTKDCEKSELAKLENVIFVGGKPLVEVPAFLQHSSCLLIPFLCNELTASIYPLKINEYLTSGKPIVCTNFSEDIRTFSEVAFIAKDHENFVTLIQESMDKDSVLLQKRRFETAQQNSWKARAAQLLEIINEDSGIS
ncbi:MAG: glycosyltransferase [Chitinophagales bacterium]